ncbi:MAG: retropepsin-like aspartic protease [bacterium]
MAVIIKNVRLEGSKGKIEKEALFDSGATYSCIQPELASCLGNLEPLPEPLELGTAKEGENVTAKERISLDFHLNGFRLSDEFMLIPNLSENVIIGAATLQKWRLKLDFEHDEVIVDPRVLKLRLIKLKGASNG